MILLADIHSVIASNAKQSQDRKSSLEFEIASDSPVRRVLAMPEYFYE
jgi:hypothetical protein